jgi:hypothetical protein
MPDSHRDRFGQRIFEALDEVVRARVVRLVHDDELVAAEPSDGVRATNGCQQSASGFAQHDVAGFVSVRVVDDLEVVEVEVGNCQWRTAALRTRQVGVEQFLQKATVGQSGQRVAQREVDEARLQQAKLGDIATDSLEAAVEESDL